MYELNVCTSVTSLKKKGGRGCIITIYSLNFEIYYCPNIDLNLQTVLNSISLINDCLKFTLTNDEPFFLKKRTKINDPHGRSLKPTGVNSKLFQD